MLAGAVPNRRKNVISWHIAFFAVNAYIQQRLFKIAMLFIRKLLILQFLRHAELISASLRLKEVQKQVQDDEVIFEFFIITLYQYFSLKEPIANMF